MNFRTYPNGEKTMMRQLATVTVLVVSSFLLTTGCGGGASNAPGVFASSASSLAVNPASLAVPVPSSTQTLSVTGAVGLLVATVADPLLASADVIGNTVKLIPFATGQTTLTVADSSVSKSVAVTINPCAPPNPVFNLYQPSTGSTGVSNTLTTITLVSQNLANLSPTVAASIVAARVVASDGTEAVRAAIVTPATPPAGATAASTYFSFSLPSLKSGKTYTVQVYLSSAPCLPVSGIVAGKFST